MKQQTEKKVRGVWVSDKCRGEYCPILAGQRRCKRCGYEVKVAQLAGGTK